MPMPISATGPSSNKGFSLIEILVVLVIIGISMGFVMMAFGDFGKSRKILTAAEQFANTIRLGEQQAILETSTLGLSISSEGYQFYRFNTQKGHWTDWSKPGPLAPHKFPSYVSVSQKNGQAKKKSPDIIFQGSGDISEFHLKFSDTQEHWIATVVGEENGQVQVIKAHEK